MGEGEGGYVWSSSNQDLGTPKKRPDLPINEATIEQHDVAPMPPFLSLAVRPNHSLEELKILFRTAPRCPRNE
jgi:hypothetical protein